MSTLNERAAKALAGRWRRGMWAYTPGDDNPPEDGGYLIAGVDEQGRPLIEFDWYGGMKRPVRDGAVPDMSDAATRGAFLDVVREAWGKPDAVVLCGDSDWLAVRNGGAYARLCRGVEKPGDIMARADTEAEALVAALEAAAR